MAVGKISYYGNACSLRSPCGIEDPMKSLTYSIHIMCVLPYHVLSGDPAMSMFKAAPGPRVRRLLTSLQLTLDRGGIHPTRVIIFNDSYPRKHAFTRSGSPVTAMRDELSCRNGA